MTGNYKRQESAEHSPYTKLRLGRIEKTYFDLGVGLGEPSEQSLPADRFLGHAQIKWLDAEGGRDLVKIGFSAFSNPVSDSGTGFAYGDLSLPSAGDLALILFRNATHPVIVGYTPLNYNLQTQSTASGKDKSFGTFRRIIPGEFTRQSKQQAEIYQDKAGAVQIIVKAQPVKSTVNSAPTGDGSDATKFSDIDPGTVPATEIARVIVGEAYVNDDLTTREKSANSTNPLVVQIRTTAGVKINIDTAGHVDIISSNGNINIQSQGGSVSLTDSGVDIDMGGKEGAGVNINGGGFPLVYALASEVNSIDDLAVSEDISVGG